MPATKNQRVPQVLSGVDGYDAIVNGGANNLPGVTTPDDLTVVVNLVAADPIFYLRIANHIVPIVKASQARAADGNLIPEWYSPQNGGVSSGPFKMTSRSISTAARLCSSPTPTSLARRPS